LFSRAENLASEIKSLQGELADYNAVSYVVVKFELRKRSYSSEYIKLNFILYFIFRLLTN